MIPENPYQITFTLKQHTPIIHFQHFLKGATLRSTELKSALDKFMILELTGCWSSEPKERLQKAIDHKNLKKWLKHADKPQNPAFDYDVEICYNYESGIDKKNTSVLDRQYKFFGNQMGDKQFKENAIYKNGIIAKDLIILIFKSAHQDLLERIDELIGKFFLLKNFGTRQSKGFGCFYPIEKYNYILTQVELPYYFDVDESLLNDFNVFGTIHLFYNTLRSGINKKKIYKENDKTIEKDVFYFKSMMWAYAKSKFRQWDKKTIKQTYNDKLHYYDKNTRSEVYKDDVTVKANRPYANNDNFPLGYEKGEKVLVGTKQTHLLWRDLLGLSSAENANYWKVSKENGSFTRFKSPIIFKPFLVGENKYRVFFGIPNYIKEQFAKGKLVNTEAEILEEWFKIQFNQSGNLKLPYHSKFDYDEFIRFAITEYSDSWVEHRAGFKDKIEFKIIDAIYKQLKTQI